MAMVFPKRGYWRYSFLGFVTGVIIFIVSIVVSTSITNRANANWANRMQQAAQIITVPTVYARVTSYTLNVRTGPSANYSVSNSIRENTTVEILERIGSAWVRIRYGDGSVGYVNSYFLSY